MKEEKEKASLSLIFSFIEDAWPRIHHGFDNHPRHLWTMDDLASVCIGCANGGRAMRFVGMPKHSMKFQKNRNCEEYPWALFVERRRMGSWR